MASRTDQLLDGEDAGGSPELSIFGRHNAATEAATPRPRRGGYGPLLANTASPAARDHEEAWQRNRAHLAAEEAFFHNAAVAAQDATSAGPRHRRRGGHLRPAQGGSLVSAYDSSVAPTAAPAPRDQGEAWLRSHAHLAAYGEVTFGQRRAAASSRPTSPASARRPRRRRRGTTTSLGCGAARTSPPTGRKSLGGGETDADPGTSSREKPGEILAQGTAIS
jgi:hypothetical protein